MRSRELDRDPREERRARHARLGSLRRAARAPARGRGSRRALGREQRPSLVLPRARAPRRARGRRGRARARRPRRRGAAAAQARGRLRRAHRAPLPLRRGGGARAPRCELGVRPVFKTVDSCGGEVAAETSYLYSSYDRIDEPLEDDRPAVLILGSGPNRIGQGIEFDYCCVQAVRSYRAQGYAAVMVNCNPETVSTDYDTADRLYFEPLTAEDVLEVVEREQPIGVVVQFGGQTPLKLARRLVERGRADPRHEPGGDRPRGGSRALRRPARPSSACARRTGRSRATPTRPSRPPSASATRCSCGRPTCSAAARCASATRPTTCARRRSRPTRSSTASSRTRSRSTSTRSATATDAIVAAVMEHVEEAGVHSGDSACVIPPLSIGPELEAEIRRQTELLVRGLGVQGLCNVQFAMHEGTIYVLEANPRASRTVPFVCKAMGIDLVDLACRVTTGSKLAEMNVAHPRAARRRRQGGRAPVRALPRLRSRARARRCARPAR